MLPEPAVPKRRRTAPAPPAAMTPLFPVPDGPASGDGMVPPGPGPRRRAAGPAGRPRQPGSRGRKDPADLLSVTAERLRRALSRSFLRYGISAEPEAAVHAAMNVIGPVLEARDAEILRLRRLAGTTTRRR